MMVHRCASDRPSGNEGLRFCLEKRQRGVSRGSTNHPWQSARAVRFGRKPAYEPRNATVFIAKKRSVTAAAGAQGSSRPPFGSLVLRDSEA